MTPTTPTDAQMKLARECYLNYMHKHAAEQGDTVVEASARAVADGSFDDGHGVQVALLAIQATEARAQGLVEAERERCLEIAKNELIKCKKRTWGWYICWRIHEAIRSQHSQHGGERER